MNGVRNITFVCHELQNGILLSNSTVFKYSNNTVVLKYTSTKFNSSLQVQIRVLCAPTSGFRNARTVFCDPITLHLQLQSQSLYEPIPAKAMGLDFMMCCQMREKASMASTARSGHTFEEKSCMAPPTTKIKPSGSFTALSEESAESCISGASTCTTVEPVDAGMLRDGLLLEEEERVASGEPCGETEDMLDVLNGLFRGILHAFSTQDANEAIGLGSQPKPQQMEEDEQEETFIAAEVRTQGRDFPAVHPGNWDTLPACALTELMSAAPSNIPPNKADPAELQSVEDELCLLMKHETRVPAHRNRSHTKRVSVVAF